MPTKPRRKNTYGQVFIRCMKLFSGFYTKPTKDELDSALIYITSAFPASQKNSIKTRRNGRQHYNKYCRYMTDKFGTNWSFSRRYWINIFNSNYNQKFHYYSGAESDIVKYTRAGVNSCPGFEESDSDDDITTESDSDDDGFPTTLVTLSVPRVSRVLSPVAPPTPPPISSPSRVLSPVAQRSPVAPPTPISSLVLSAPLPVLSESASASAQPTHITTDTSDSPFVRLGIAYSDQESLGKSLRSRLSEKTFSDKLPMAYQYNPDQHKSQMGFADYLTTLRKGFDHWLFLATTIGGVLPDIEKFQDSIRQIHRLTRDPSVKKFLSDASAV